MKKKCACAFALPSHLHINVICSRPEATIELALSYLIQPEVSFGHVADKSLLTKTLFLRQESVS